MIHIIKETKFLNSSDIESYSIDDLVVIVDNPIKVYKVCGNKMNKFLQDITNNDHLLLLESTSFEYILCEVTKIRHNESLQLLNYNKNISLTEEEVQTIKLLREIL